ncbi:putative baseplate protein [Erwinia phage FIfi106]|nr:putative baseplate protein [Erwinia phage FIfi106]
MAYEKIESLTTKALDDYTPSQFKEKNVYSQVLSAVTTELQKVEDTLWDMYKKKGLNTAEGIQLDYIGALLNVPRQVGLSDEAYRLVIYSQILIRRADTTADSIMKAMQAVHSVDTSQLWEHYSGVMTGGIVVKVVTNDPVDDAARILNNISAATIGSAVILRDENNGLAWTPVEIQSDELFLTDEDENRFITNGAQNITVTTKSGSTEENLIGSLADEGMKQYNLAVEVENDSKIVTGDFIVRKNTTDGTLKIEQPAALGGIYGYFAEVSQLRSGQLKIEGT